VCRSIRTLRPPYLDDVGDAEVRAAALQYVRKVSGMRAPAPHNAEAFQDAVDAVAAATQDLLDRLVVRGSTARRGSAPAARAAAEPAGAAGQQHEAVP